MRNNLLLSFFFLTLLTNAARSQAIDSLKVPARDSSEILPPLKDLIDSAIKYNALVHFNNRAVILKETNLKSQRNFWTRNMGFQADTRFGTYDNFATTDNGQSTTLMSSTARQLNYGLGVYMKFPLLDLLNRKNQVNQAKTELEQAKDMAEVQAEEIRLLVIRQYHEVLLKYKLLVIKSQSFSNARVSMDMTEKEFRNGISTIADYNRVSELYTKSEIDFETASSEFLSAKMILEEIAGFNF